MPEIHFDSDLQSLNSFGLAVKAKALTTIKNLEDLHALEIPDMPLLVLGGGSNVLFTKDFPGIVVKNEIFGLVSEETETEVRVSVGAGWVWDDFVAFCVEKGWGGLENLSLIPGTVGASPIQNIGAYGVEMCHSFVELKAFHWKTREIHSFNAKDCRFGYRDSVFKREFKDEYCIAELTFQLSKNPVLNLEYGAIRQELEKSGVSAPDISAVRNVVCSIRNSKLPNPKEIGNAGSFFKNPEIDSEKCKSLQAVFPDIPVYPLANGYKVAAGWLIEQTGWKGKRHGGAGCHTRQALVLVNVDGKASGKEILELAELIRTSVWETFGIEIQPEVNIL